MSAPVYAAWTSSGHYLCCTHAANSKPHLSRTKNEIDCTHADCVWMCQYQYCISCSTCAPLMHTFQAGQHTGRCICSWSPPQAVTAAMEDVKMICCCALLCSYSTLTISRSDWSSAKGKAAKGMFWGLQHTFSPILP